LTRQPDRRCVEEPLDGLEDARQEQYAGNEKEWGDYQSLDPAVGAEAERSGETEFVPGLAADRERPEPRAARAGEAVAEAVDEHSQSDGYTDPATDLAQTTLYGGVYCVRGRRTGERRTGD
jgi:hypothetical protein